MSRVIESVKRQTAAALRRRAKALQSKGVQNADQAILDGLTILGRQPPAHVVQRQLVEVGRRLFDAHAVAEIERRPVVCGVPVALYPFLPIGLLLFGDPDVAAVVKSLPEDEPEHLQLLGIEGNDGG